ncbi:hypothetical protein AGR6A_Lc90369 [Agrobacterium sp. NCPPB 925]|nr:hypothetical protein AGR6A_Lc90369 [Agrobacterium sp. NCPPB 925]
MPRARGGLAFRRILTVEIAGVFSAHVFHSSNPLGFNPGVTVLFQKQKSGLNRTRPANGIGLNRHNPPHPPR